ncbi:alpha/beta hydrolase, partial [Planctomycetota bacterium]
MATLDLRLVLAIAFFCLPQFCLPQLSHGEKPDDVIAIWPGDPPGDKMDVGPEQDFTKDTDQLIAGRRIIKLGNVSLPEAHVYLPPANLRTGASVVICPGGGFSILAWDLEGTEVAQWLSTLGVAGIVLKYRVPTRDQNPHWKAPTQDAQRTISLVRHHAKEWKIEKDKVAVLGFSAGGMAAAKTTLAKKRYYESVDEADQESFRPNRSILIYAAGLPKGSRSNDEGDGADTDEDAVTSETPPVFMVHAFDDFVPVQGTANMLLAMKKANVPCELHVYESGGHGYG